MGYEIDPFEMNVDDIFDSDDPEYFLEIKENQKLLLANSFLLIPSRRIDNFTREKFF